MANLEDLRPAASLEIGTLTGLEGLALTIRRSGEDKKWRELATLLSEIFTPAAISNEMAEEEQRPFDSGAALRPKPVSSPSQKLVIFTCSQQSFMVASLGGEGTSLFTRFNPLRRNSDEASVKVAIAGCNASLILIA